jgi:hypothetical protein
VELVRNGNWCRGQIPATDLTGLEPVTFTAQTPFGPVTQKRTILTDWAQVPAEDRLVTFVLEKEPPSIGPSDPIELVIRAVAVEGGVVANRKFVIGYFPHEGWEPGYSFDVVSDSEGRISMKLDPLQYSGIITLSVSTGHEPLVDKPTWGEAWILRVGNAK